MIESPRATPEEFYKLILGNLSWRLLYSTTAATQGRKPFSYDHTHVGTLPKTTAHIAGKYQQR